MKVTIEKPELLTWNYVRIAGRIIDFQTTEDVEEGRLWMKVGKVYTIEHGKNGKKMQKTIPHYVELSSKTDMREARVLTYGDFVEVIGQLSEWQDTSNKHSNIKIIATCVIRVKCNSDMIERSELTLVGYVGAAPKIMQEDAILATIDLIHKKGEQDKNQHCPVLLTSKTGVVFARNHLTPGTWIMVTGKLFFEGWHDDKENTTRPSIVINRRNQVEILEFEKQPRT